MNIYDKTITILNRLKAIDSGTNRDIYYPFTLNNCGWYEQAIADVDGTKVSMSTTFKIYIPFTGLFLPYNEWKKAGMQNGNYTMSQGDTIILGTVGEQVTPSNITKIKQEFEPNVCEVRHVRVCDERNGTLIQLFVEGV